ncbi:MAG: PASTA domain-containing protein, partial [Bacteroidales bacterium]|nr:PASTA domain-containing protein [Bacteroidales bacterium]
MSKTGTRIPDFFKPHRLGFHLLLAFVIILVIFIICSIFLKIYTRHGDEIEMPNFIGQPSETLIKEQPNDFIIVVTDQVYDSMQPAGTVIKQNPLPKEHVKKGRKVYLTVSSAVPPKIKMPPLIDVSMRQAEIMLSALGLKMGSPIYKQSPFENLVLEQLYKGRA